MPWIELFRTNFQGIIWGLRVSLPHGSPHLRLRSWWSKPYAWGVLRSSVARRKAVFPEICYPPAGLSCWGMSTLGIFFIPTIYLQAQKSFFPPVFPLPNYSGLSYSELLCHTIPGHRLLSSSTPISAHP